jgi:predicted  nucleic acid-binding Zn-ribbon protein
MASYVQLGSVTVRISETQSVETILLGCLECGSSVFDRDAHDHSHDLDAAEATPAEVVTNAHA